MRGRREDDLEREIRSHLEIEAEEQRESGLSPEEARQAARRAFGSIAFTKERVRAAWGWTLLEQTAADLRYTLRSLRRSPVIAAAAVLSLALGIGANLAIFGLADAVLLRPLPVAQPEQIERLTLVQSNRSWTTVSYPIFQALRKHSRAFSGVIARWPEVTSMAVGQDPDRAVVELVSGNYFPVLGVSTVLGRPLSDKDDGAPMSGPVAVISYRCWSEKMGRDPEAVGRTIRIGGYPFSVIGVAPAAFFGVEVGVSPDAWIPITMVDAVRPGSGGNRLGEVGQMWLNVLGRRAPGVTRAQAQAETVALFPRLVGDALRRWRAEPPVLTLEPGGRGLSRLRDRFENPLLLLLALAGLVLLIACGNIANLLLARTAARRHEIGLRIALGASRTRLLRQLLAESLLLSCGGGALALALAFWGIRFLLSFLPADQASLAVHAHTDASLFGVALALSAFAAFASGAVPAAHSVRMNLSPALKDTSSQSRSPRSLNTRRMLVVVQIALSLTLVAGAGLFYRSLRMALAADLGLVTENALMARVSPGEAGYPPDQRAAFYRELETRLRAAPGVRAVGYTSAPILAGGFAQQGTRSRPSAQSWNFLDAGGDFFAAVGIRIVRGRAFLPRDAASSKMVLVIDEAAARQDFPGTDPIGRRHPRYAPENQIVGIARDAKLRGIHELPAAAVYMNSDQERTPAGHRVYFVRTASDPAPYRSLIASVVRGLDRGVPVSEVKTFAERKSESLVLERLLAALSGFFGILALLLAGIGTYGVVAYGMERRTREIGIRVSLGASRGSVIWMAVRGSLITTLAGIAIGLPLCLWVSGLTASLLFGVRPHDPTTLLATVGVLAAVAILAAWIPARRASRVSPMAALRHE